MLLFTLDKYLQMELVGQMVAICLIKKLSHGVPKLLYHYVFQGAVCESSSSPHLYQRFFGQLF